MLKSVTTKIFVAFTTLIILEGATFATIFSHLITRETETYILDSLSLRSQLRAHEITNHAYQGPEYFILSSDPAKTRSKLPDNFDPQALLALAPVTGSSVTSCQDLENKHFYCSFTAIPGSNIWTFETVPQGSVFEVFQKLRMQITIFLVAWIILSLLLTYAASRFLLNPLRQFSMVSDKVASGSFDSHDLPTGRLDEIGELARSMSKMLNQLKQREFHLGQSAQQLVHSARLASIGQMGASIAHEVKNPLMSMIGYAKILQKKCLDPETKEAAEIIYKESERCSQILSQMLRFSRSESTEARPFKLQEVIDSTLLLLKSESKNRQIAIHSSVSTDIVVRGRAEQIQQVLLNLLMNALQASPSGASISLSAKESTQSISLEIKDHGSGIPPEVQKHIFDPFFTTKDKREGTGLGLSVAQDLIHQHGSELTFESIPGKGTTFRFSLSSS